MTPPRHSILLSEPLDLLDMLLLANASSDHRLSFAKTSGLAPW